MESIRQYIISVVSAGVLCSLIQSLCSSKSTSTALIRLLCGIFMALTVVSPLVRIRLDDYTNYFSGIIYESNAVVGTGDEDAYNALRAIIKDNTEAYILDKADSLGLVLNVEVTLNDDNPPVPCKVVLVGNVAPYAKKVLCEYIAEDLGISKEDQIWG